MATMAMDSHVPPPPRHNPKMLPPRKPKLPLDNSDRFIIDENSNDSNTCYDDMPPLLTETTRSSSPCYDSSPPTPTCKQHEHAMNSTRTADTTGSDSPPHYSSRHGINRNSTQVSVHSESSTLQSNASGAVRAARLAENLMRSQHRDPMEIYKLVNVLGEGSMGSVCKVQKKSSAVGGSARPANVRKSLGDNDNRRKHKERPCCFSLVPGFFAKLKIFQLPKRHGSSSILCASPSLDELDDDDDDNYDSARSDWTTTTASDNIYCNSILLESSSNDRSYQNRRSSSMISYGSGRRRAHVYALKSIHLEKCANPQLQQELLHEVAILREIDHPHIARAMETFDYNERLYICLELCSGGDLYTRDPYTERNAAEIVKSILSAVSYLHSRGIIHRDLKYENIMFADRRPDAEVKLIDFGLSQKFASHDEHLSDAVGTVYTMAPELLAGQYNSKADVWSVGVIAYMLMSSSMPFFGKTRYAVMKQICKGKIKFLSRRWKTVSKYGKGFALHLLEGDPQERPSADRALKYAHKWARQLEELELAQQPSAEPQQQSAQSQPQLEDHRGVSASNNNNHPQRKISWCSNGSFGDHDVEMMDRIQASIQAFAHYNTLKKLALMVIAYKSTASEIGWLRSTFNQFDLLQNGEISLEEFTQALSDVYDYSPEEIENLFVGMDIDGTGSVHYTEFLASTIEAHGSIDEDRIADAFDRIDCDDSGYITIQNLRDFLGHDVPQSYLEAIIDDADLVRDKRICYDEFLQLWDPSCDATLREAKAEVAERRTRRSESLLISLSRDSSLISDDDDDSDDDNAAENDRIQRQQITSEPLVDQQDPSAEEGVVSVASSIEKTLMPSNTGAREYGATAFFSQRKALSIRSFA